MKHRSAKLCTFGESYGFDRGGRTELVVRKSAHSPHITEIRCNGNQQIHKRHRRAVCTVEQRAHPSSTAQPASQLHQTLEASVKHRKGPCAWRGFEGGLELGQCERSESRGVIEAGGRERGEHSHRLVVPANFFAVHNTPPALLARIGKVAEVYLNIYSQFDVRAGE